jgi:muramoyltetrapeptide carboxypeptidase
LHPGATLGIVAPASAPPDPKVLDRAIAGLEQLGYRIKLAPHVHKRWGYLAGTDRERASDLMRMFSDRQVAAILCVRGGYGTARLLPLLDYRAIRAQAKILVGYSDITALHCALLTQAGLVSFHGPMLNSDFGADPLPDFTVQSFLRTLASAAKAPTLITDSEAKTIKVLRRGIAHGPLLGGNLSVLCTTIGTRWQPSFRNKILFLEDVGEAPYRWDRMLTHLWNCGLLQQVAGIAIGRQSPDENPPGQAAQEYRQTVEDVLRERLLPLKVPVLVGLPFGHVAGNATIPIGIRTTLNANLRELLLTESAVR